jgi:hypothetical protein
MEYEKQLLDCQKKFKEQESKNNPNLESTDLMVLFDTKLQSKLEEKTKLIKLRKTKLSTYLIKKGYIREEKESNDSNEVNVNEEIDEILKKKENDIKKNYDQRAASELIILKSANELKESADKISKSQDDCRKKYTEALTKVIKPFSHDNYWCKILQSLPEHSKLKENIINIESALKKINDSTITREELNDFVSFCSGFKTQIESIVSMSDQTFGKFDEDYKKIQESCILYLDTIKSLESKAKECDKEYDYAIGQLSIIPDDVDLHYSGNEQNNDANQDAKL